MAIETEGWRERQKRVLAKYREQSKRSRDEIAHAANLTYWRYVRFEEGQTSLPAEYIPELERAYGLAWGELSEALELVPGRMTLRQRLVDGGLTDDEIRDAISEAIDKRLSPSSERHWAEFLIAQAEKRRQDSRRATS